MVEQHEDPEPVDDVRTWSPERRAAVAQALAALADATAPPPPKGRRHFVIALVALAAVVLIPWVVFLSISLHDRHRVLNWNLAWVGFDVLLLVAFAANAWAMWRRRLVVIPLFAITATLLLVDCWFDVTMSWGTRDQTESIQLALLVELPLCILLMETVRLNLRRISDSVDRLRGSTGPRRSVLSLPLPIPHGSSGDVAPGLIGGGSSARSSR